MEALFLLGMVWRLTVFLSVKRIILSSVELPGLVVHSVYRPPAKQFLLPPLGSRNMPHIVIVGFNSRNTLWGYTSTDIDGETVELWAESINLSLIQNVKMLKSFNSAIWKKWYNPDLIFASSNILNMCDKSVLESIIHTQTPHNMCQYKPINRCTTYHIQKTLQPEESRVGRIFNGPW